MNARPTVEELFERYVQHHVEHGVKLSPEELCGHNADLLARLRSCIESYHELDATLAAGKQAASPEPTNRAPLPEFDSFETIEKLGAGGMGEVYKVRDPTLERIVAVKVLRDDSLIAEKFGNFLREAKSLALFRDPRIVQIHEFRPDADPPLIVMEHVDGFLLTNVAPSLEHKQRACILLEVCEAVHHAHELGIQHRDLKPANILLDQKLSPKILDFGLSSGDPTSGHLVGTPPYLAPEQLDPQRPIDERSDVYALGVIFYELLCGRRPYVAEMRAQLFEEIEAGQPPLPVEIDQAVPEPLQAIALKAMEARPADRYASAKDMALDLKRYLDDRPVLARPTIYATALDQRVRPHLDQIDEWTDLKLIYPHEASRLKSAYSQLESREDDWIVQSRILSYSQIALYFGAFLLLCGGLLYFGAHRIYEAVERAYEPVIVLGLPFVGLNLGAYALYRREHRAVSVAFYLAGILLLPLFLLVFLHDAALFMAASDAANQLFEDIVSNRQLQVATFIALCWSTWLALRTRTIGLSSSSTLMLLIFTLAVLTDFGLDEWLEEERWDLLSLHLAPLVFVQGLLAYFLERSERPFSSRPLYVGAALLWIVVLELLALDGKAFEYLGLSMARFQAEEVADPVLLDTLAAMTVIGIVIYLTAWLMERLGTSLMKWAAVLLVIVSPFATLEPAAYLVHTDEYSRNYDWLYLTLAVGITVLSHHRQRRSFYLAGLVNSGAALFLITLHQEWFDEPAWGVIVIAVGVALLVAGYFLYLGERSRQRVGSSST